MLKPMTMFPCAIAGAVTAAMLCGWTSDASAQDCNDRYPCQAFGSPPLQGTQPLPVAPPMFAPYGAQSPEPTMPPGGPRAFPQAADPAPFGRYASLYAPVGGEPFPVPAVDLGRIDPQFLRRTVSYPTSEPPATIVIDPGSRFLYLVQGGGQAIRYGVGVGHEGFGWSGTANVRERREWPDWYPPKEMIQRQPEGRAAERHRHAGRATQSARRARPLSLAGQQGHALPHPRHRRAMDHRQQRVVRLHPHDQPGRDGPVPARTHQREGGGAGIARVTGDHRPMCPDWTFERPGTSVTDRTGHMGYTSCFLGGLYLQSPSATAKRPSSWPKYRKCSSGSTCAVATSGFWLR